MVNDKRQSVDAVLASTRAIGFDPPDLSPKEQQFLRQAKKHKLSTESRNEFLKYFKANDLDGLSQSIHPGFDVDDKSGTVSSKFSGHSISFSSGGKAQAEKDIQTHDAKIKRELLLSMLELSTTSPEVIASIYKNNPPIGPDGKPQMTDAYMDFIARKVEPYIRADLANMSENDLLRWSNEFKSSAGISSLLKGHQNKLELVKSLVKAQLPEGLNGRELDELIGEHSNYAWLRESAEFNTKPAEAFDVLGIKNDLADIRDSLKVIGEHLFSGSKGIFRQGIEEGLRKEFGWPYESFNLLG